MSVRIVPITEEHVDSYHACLDAIARERRYLALLQAPAIEATRAFVRHNIANGEIQLVAVDGADVVGWCDIVSRPHQGFEHVGALGMGVAAKHRRHGLGEQLVREALRMSRDKGLERIELEVFASNQAAIALYRKLGFQEEGTKRRARRLDGNYDDVLLLALFLLPA
jgi:ribosomal protein S18 acetylase RimI-like enzyme